MTTTNTARAAYVPTSRRNRTRVGTFNSVARRYAILDALAGRRAAMRRRALAKQLTAFCDAAGAEAKAVELVETGGLIPASRPGLYLAVASDGTNTYLIDTVEGSCTCQGHARTGHCYHRLAAVMTETRAADLIDA
jgi:hypothetical protein